LGRSRTGAGAGATAVGGGAAQPGAGGAAVTAALRSRRRCGHGGAGSGDGGGRGDGDDGTASGGPDAHGQAGGLVLAASTQRAGHGLAQAGVRSGADADARTDAPALVAALPVARRLVRGAGRACPRTRRGQLRAAHGDGLVVGKEHHPTLHGDSPTRLQSRGAAPPPGEGCGTATPVAGGSGRQEDRPRGASLAVAPARDGPGVPQVGTLTVDPLTVDPLRRTR